MSTSSEILRRNAIANMRSPYDMGIICIDITNKCDLACSNCTRLLANQDGFWDMSLENFRLAARSLADYPGIVAIIGGNPVMHRRFEDICAILVEEIPEKERRGLWTNNVFKFAELAKETFGIFNLNPHGVERGVKSLEPLREGSWYHAGHSSHSPLLTAMQDLFDETEMWERIGRCDINHNWSASIVENNGRLRAYFCEVAASFDLARGTDFGVDVEPGWWRRNVASFDDQVARFCPGCGVPAKVIGHMDFEEIDTYTQTNADIAEASLRKKRKIIVLDKAEARFLDHKVTEYSPKLRAEAQAHGADCAHEAATIAIPRPRSASTTSRIELELAKFLCTIGLTRTGTRLWNAAKSRM
ncbi:radical SAM protein [Methylosinus sp. Sm6]|uniref:radical SAM protein n=1 Tax=Methylosinus sp. Sm6 TaxID=2866948 RepID=UPI001C98F574|nr:radical SAM protein [Methylosinus sp. Sm6]MBY6241850.1 radical SAM protein [Methylosinus sp. Sm6]